MRNLILAFVVFVGLQSALSAPLHAQASNCVSWVGNGWTPLGGCPPGTIEVSVEGPFLDNCLVVTPACPPVAAAGETCPTCAAAAAGKPISLASGNTFIKETDVSVPGLFGGLTLTRTWNSLWPSTQTAYQVGLFGPNWRSNFEERIFVGSDNYIKYARGDGSFWSFGYSTAGTLSVAAPANQNATLVQGTSFWTLTFQNGEKRLFANASGNLTEIIDRNGNITQLAYDGIGRLTTVTDPVSRQLTFSYANGSSFLVVGVASNFGVSLTYTYDSQNRLSVVTNPDLSTYTFGYNSQSLITSVTDSQGVILESHTYDSLGRGLTSSQANGVQAVTLSYTN
jgi:YD repeat-containing protein